MGIVFLDVDGVLNTNHLGMEEHLVENLSHIINVTGAKIVVSSNWRYGGIGPGSDFDKHMRASGGGDLMNSVIDRTGVMETREEEILAWVEDHDVKNWVAIDDMRLELPWAHFVNTIRAGLTKSKADEAISKLSSAGDLFSKAFYLLVGPPGIEPGKSSV